MSNQHPDELSQRLRALTAHHVPVETRTRHLAAIEAELPSPAAESSPRTSNIPTRWRVRRWLAGVAAASTVLGPGVAVAAQRAVPGDALHGVKLTTERLHVLLAPDVIARNRVRELATLLQRGAPTDVLQRATVAAQEAVAVLPADHPLHGELALLIARIGGRGEPASSDTTDSAGNRSTGTADHETDVDPRRDYGHHSDDVQPGGSRTGEVHDDGADEDGDHDHERADQTDDDEADDTEDPNGVPDDDDDSNDEADAQDDDRAQTDSNDITDEDQEEDSELEGTDAAGTDAADDDTPEDEHDD